MNYSFEWDEKKNLQNQAKHGISFEESQYVFKDKNRIILIDEKHSESEKRYFCIGKIEGEILTVRFTYRNNKIRIFGAAYWRAGKKQYEKKAKGAFYAKK